MTTVSLVVMASTELLGKHEEKQAMALGVLKRNGSMEYEELKDALGLEHDEMQEVMRGIKYNGLVRELSRDSGARYYVPDW